MSRLLCIESFTDHNLCTLQIPETTSTPPHVAYDVTGTPTSQSDGSCGGMEYDVITVSSVTGTCVSFFCLFDY